MFSRHSGEEIMEQTRIEQGGGGPQVTDPRFPRGVSIWQEVAGTK